METSQQKFLPNPRDSKNILYTLFFTWTVPIFKQGYRKILQMEDMYRPLKCDLSNSLGDRLEANWKKQLAKPGRPSIIRAVVATFWREYTIFGLMCGFNDIVLRLVQPLLLGQLLRYFREDPEITYEDAIWCASGILVITAINTIIINQFFFLGFHNGMKIRVAMCSLIYRKALKLSQTALGETAAGKVVNLLSNDVNRFDMVSMFINSMWTAPIVTICVGILLYVQIGVPAFIGIVVVFIVVPIQTYTGKLSSKFRLQTALRTDERVRFMDEIISGIQVIKMYAWEKPFSKLITLARKMELKIVRKNSYVRGLFMTFMLFTTRMAIFCTMLSIALLYSADQITAAKVFVMSSYYGVISHTMSQMFVRGVAEIAEALVAFKRLQSFLLLDEKIVESIGDGKAEQNGKGGEKNGILSEKIELNEKTNGVNYLADTPPNVAVSIKNATARWTMPKRGLQTGSSKSHRIAPVEDQNAWKSPTLKQINVEFPKGKLVGIIGPVGSGKSSFLQALLRELPFESGTLSINGSVSYACQEPWVFAASVRQNILFGENFDRHRYDAVVETCALTKDFQQFENGDRTVVGDRGASLSGGQKARINLARACYRNADIYLLDDPLSAVDAHVGTHIFNKCLGPNSRLARLQATRILVTHQVHFLKEADWLVILKDGKIEAQGTPSDLSRSGVDFAELITNDDSDDNDENPDRAVSRQVSKMSRRSSNKSLRSLSTSSSKASLEDADKEEEEEKELGVGMEESSKGKVKGSVTASYFRAGANWFGLSILLIFFIISQILASAADYWVSVWTGQEEMRTHEKNKLLALQNDPIDGPSIKGDTNFDEKPAHSFTLSTEMCMIIHGTILATLFIVAISRSMAFYTICVRASQKLHNAMFSGLVSASMRFFDTNPSGRIMNRFSKDIGAMDEFLPKAILDATQVILSMVGSVIVAATVNPYFLIPVAVMSILFVYVRKVYLKTAKNIKRLEGIAKSPVFTHLGATLNGLSTIRAYKAEKILKAEFDNHQDTHSACWFMFVSTGSAFGLSLDVMCLIFVSSIMCYFMFIDVNVPGEQVGLAITQAMTLIGMLQWGVRQSADISNQMMSVERVLEYRDLEPEKQPKTPREVPVDWPATGRIEFRKLVYRYYAEGEPVLRDLSFEIKAKEKIGIVGRTGAGKSSMIGALFRLACIDGEILIDDIETSTVHLSELRKRIAIIPQDPVLFSGTLRRNLDPFEEYSDDDIWNALEKVELTEVAAGPLGLHSAVMAHGSNYSVGQRQLLCLARAILRKNRILVLDEATANVDPQTDLLIQHTIREKFAECTVLTIAHRLHTIIDSDRILVMDTGRVAEFNEPHTLLRNHRGIFYSMVKALGPHEFKRLAEVAHDQFNAVHNIDLEEINL